LTRKQRSLIIVIMCFLIYISFCSVVNVYVVAINRNFIEALYFSLVTIQTIGFGDIVPHNAGGRVWTCVSATFGELSIRAIC
jgi:potassium channel subfamily K, other eukaryote